MTSWNILRFPVTDFAADDQGAFSWIIRERLLCLLIVCEKNVYRDITNNFPSKWHRPASTVSACKSSPGKIFHWNSSGERRLKFISERIEDNRETENIA